MLQPAFHLGSSIGRGPVHRAEFGIQVDHQQIMVANFKRENYQPLSVDGQPEYQILITTTITIIIIMQMIVVAVMTEIRRQCRTILILTRHL